jgi:hypothetical protein
LQPKGTIPPRSRLEIDWIFNPLSVRKYQITVPINIENSEPVNVKLVGHGLSDNVELNEHDKDLIPIHPTLKRDMGSLSLERLVFGCVPVFSTSKSLIVVNNEKEDEPIQFRWMLEEYENLHITPRMGVIPAKGSVMCVLEFTAGEEPRIYHLDVECHLNTVKELNNHKEALDVLNELRTEQQNAIAHDRRNISTDNLSRFKTIPPIGSRNSIANNENGSNLVICDVPHKSSESATSGNQESTAPKKRTKEFVQVHEYLISVNSSTPPSPKPDVLLLSINARALNMEEFQRKYAKQMVNYIKNEPVSLKE